jgi:2-isopropylmalate synthase
MSYDHRKYSAFRPVQAWQRKWPDRVIDRAPDWCAVDLRDGNQALVNPMTVEQKTQLFSLLVDIGCREIEVGFPAASQPDFDFVRKIIETGMVPDDVSIQVLTQAREDLIARSVESLKGAKKASLHLYNSTSTVQRERVFGMDRDAIRDIAVQGARWIKAMAAQHPETDWEFQYSPESFTGTELEYCAEVVNAVIAVWQPHTGQKVVINLPATVETSTPNVYADMIEWMCAHIDHRDQLRVSVHTHNDRGCGVAAAELGVMAGADRVEGTLLGNGERTGNMCLVTMAMNLYSQGVDPQLDFSDLRRIVRTVEQCTGISTHPRHAYAGELVYTAFSGSHQDAIRKSLARQRDDEPWQVAYLPIDPCDVGRSYEEVVRINSQSGKGGVLYVLEREFGITLPRWLQIEFSRVVQRHAEQTGGEVGGAIIRQLFDEAYVAVPEGWRLGNFDIHRDGGRVRMEATVGGQDVAGEGKGAVEALIDALRRVHGVNGSVEAFDEYALGSGTAASAMACIKLRIGTEISVGVALAEDTSTATLQAVLSAFGRQKAGVSIAA